jgi:hypothetical protein
MYITVVLGHVHRLCMLANAMIISLSICVHGSFTYIMHKLCPCTGKLKE